jgi:hypothetical protein
MHGQVEKHLNTWPGDSLSTAVRSFISGPGQERPVQSSDMAGSAEPTDAFDCGAAATAEKNSTRKKKSKSKY